VKLYYVSTTEQLGKLVHEWHALDLGNGHHLTCVRWRDEATEMQWASHPDVIALPHPIFQSAAVVPDEPLAHLRDRFELPDGATVHHVIQSASKDDPWMRLHVL
jgi:hypothetical protein